MNGSIFVLIFLLLTLLVLIAGLVVLAIGGEINKKYSAKLMMLRVTMQLMVIISLFLLYFFSS